jgi:uncharacterized Zn finger protein
MMGSGIYGQSVEYEEFDCDRCGQNNTGGEVITNDWGHYEIECEFCSAVYRESSIKEDYEEARADEAYDDWRDSQL